MTYTDAVKAAINGEESGYTFLFEETYKSKLYLSIQYMKNEEAAEDVLQDAYIKAFSRLDTLREPEHFSSWFGQIVANTAKDALEKKNPLLFTDLATETDEGTSDFEVVDEDISNQPELSYTREETRKIVQELMDSLSPEQRICVLMFHIDGESIKEIAEALDCSENTVKSRLNYGRKNIKAKVEELEKKGYKILGVAPVVFFILLIRNDAYAMSLDPEFIALARKLGADVFSHLPNGPKGPGPDSPNGQGPEVQNGQEQIPPTYQTQVPPSGAYQTAGTGAGQGTATGTASAAQIGYETAAKAAGKTVKKGFINTVAGKVVIVVAGVAFAGGAVVGVTQAQRQNRQESADTVIESVMAEDDAFANGADISGQVMLTEEETIEEAAEMAEAEEEPPIIRTFADNEYPELLEGGLTKSQFEYMLAVGPQTMSNGKPTDNDIFLIIEDITLNGILQQGWGPYGSPEEIIGVSVEHGPYIDYGTMAGYFEFNLAQLENALSIFTESSLSNMSGVTVLTEPVAYERMPYIGDQWESYIYGNTFYAPHAEGDGGSWEIATITDSVIINDTMVVTYEVVSSMFPTGELIYDEMRTAILKQISDGRYKVDSITKGMADSVVVDGWEINLDMIRHGDIQTAVISSEDAEAIRALYEQVLEDVQDGKYEFTMLENIFEGYVYFLLDMNRDGIKELAVSAQSTPGSGVGIGVFIFDDCRVFTAELRDETWVLQPVSGEVEMIGEYVPVDGNGFYALMDYGRGSGNAEMYRVTIQNGELSVGAWEHYSAADGTLQRFVEINHRIDCLDINDLSGLDEVSVSYAKKVSETDSDVTSGDGSIFPDSSTRVLTSSEIAALSDTDLRIAINEIYARHGYIFESQDLLDHFRQFDWYHETVPKNSWNDSMFNSVERQNVDLLSAERGRR